MSDFVETKLADSVPRGTPGPLTETRHGKHVPNHSTAAEQSREAQEARDAEEAGGATRDKMIQIGRGNQQAGRQGQ